MWAKLKGDWAWVVWRDDKINEVCLSGWRGIKTTRAKVSEVEAWADTKQQRDSGDEDFPVRESLRDA